MQKKIKINGRSYIVNFQQFSSIDEACNILNSAQALLLLNKAHLAQQMQQLRYATKDVPLQAALEILKQCDPDFQPA